jgi:hypothetical protein
MVAVDVELQPFSPNSTSIVPPHASQRSIRVGATSLSLARPHAKQ